FGDSARRKSRSERRKNHVVSAIPKGWCGSAQGCEERATLGPSHIGLNPNGVVSRRRRRAAIPSGLFVIGHIPRVARASQPWALSQNPFGIHLSNFRKALTLAPLLLGFLAVEAI